MKPIFPFFKKLRLSDKKTIERKTASFKSYSDFNFASLWNYNTEDSIQWSILNDNLVIIFSDYITGKPFLSFLGKNKVSQTAKKLMSYAKKHSLPNYMKLIPEEVIEADSKLKEHFTIKEDPDNFDYILSIEEYKTFRGNKFASKRKNLKKFLQEYPDHVLKSLDLSKKSTQNDIFKLFMEWTEFRKISEEAYKHEFIATKRFIENIKHFDHIALGVRHKNKLISYIIAEKSHQNYTHNHFIKNLLHYKGLFEATDHYFAQEAHKLGYLYNNIQQHLGKEGLKSAKELGRPIVFLKKYILKPLKA